MLLEILAVCLIGNKRSLTKQKQKIWDINANIGALTTFPQSKIKQLQFSSVQFSRSFVSNSLWPQELQHTRPPCPSPTAGVYPNPCPLSRWWHSTISSSTVPFSCPQSFPASGFFKWVSSSHQVAKVLEFQLQHQSSNEHPRLISFRMYWLDLLAVQGTLKSLLQHHSSKASIFQPSAFFIVQLSHHTWLLEKP